MRVRCKRAPYGFQDTCLRTQWDIDSSALPTNVVIPLCFNCRPKYTISTNKCTLSPSSDEKLAVWAVHLCIYFGRPTIYRKCQTLLYMTWVCVCELPFVYDISCIRPTVSVVIHFEQSNKKKYMLIASVMKVISCVCEWCQAVVCILAVGFVLFSSSSLFFHIFFWRCCAYLCFIVVCVCVPLELEILWRALFGWHAIQIHHVLYIKWNTIVIENL